jgi:FdhD protein
MRTPGHDDELAVGFLLGERVIGDAHFIESITVEPVGEPGRRLGDVARVALKPDAIPNLRRIERNFAATSSCGVCGKASLRALGLDHGMSLAGRGPIVEAGRIHDLPDALRAAQAMFQATGGLHAAALFDERGALVAVREDIGRHNAVDELVGARALGRLERVVADDEPLGLLVSSRIGFEIVQKALAAGLALVAAVGAPSSLAVEVAEAFGMTLLGFVGPSRFNMYCGAERVRPSGAVVVAEPVSASASR